MRFVVGATIWSLILFVVLLTAVTPVHPALAQTDRSATTTTTVVRATTTTVVSRTTTTVVSRTTTTTTTTTMPAPTTVSPAPTAPPTTSAPPGSFDTAPDTPLVQVCQIVVWWGGGTLHPEVDPAYQNPSVDAGHLNIFGSGFQPGEQVNILIDGSHPGVVGDGPPIADGEGNFLANGPNTGGMMTFIETLPPPFVVTAVGHQCSASATFDAVVTNLPTVPELIEETPIPDPGGNSMLLIIVVGSTLGGALLAGLLYWWWRAGHQGGGSSGSPSAG
jgi:hypothetical protein